jgi:DNA-binding MarR family transcriptional regulator
MELRHLRYLVGVAEALSFTKAAQKLHTAQPSLTRQIRDLEEELGVRLLNRTKQQVTLTEEGRSFLADANCNYATLLPLQPCHTDPLLHCSTAPLLTDNMVSGSRATGVQCFS